MKLTAHFYLVQRCKHMKLCVRHPYVLKMWRLFKHRDNMAYSNSNVTCRTSAGEPADFLGRRGILLSHSDHIRRLSVLMSNWDSVSKSIYLLLFQSCNIKSVGKGERRKSTSICKHFHQDSSYVHFPRELGSCNYPTDRSHRRLVQPNVTPFTGYLWLSSIKTCRNLQYSY
jgi:hypothetical protein